MAKEGLKHQSFAEFKEIYLYINVAVARVHQRCQIWKRLYESDITEADAANTCNT